MDWLPEHKDNASCRLIKCFKQEEHKRKGRMAHDDLISRMHSGLQETLKEIQDLPVTQQVSSYVTLLQFCVGAVFTFVLDSKGHACNKHTAVVHHVSCLAGYLSVQASNSICCSTIITCRPNLHSQDSEMSIGPSHC